MSEVREATVEDISGLVRLRAQMFAELRDDFGEAPFGDGWRDACAAALKERLAADDTRIVVVGDGATGPIASGMGVIDQRLPSPYNRTGRVGYIFGVITDPAHRHRGHARAIMKDLIAWFDARGVDRVDLHATESGIPLYRSLGFTEHPEPTYTRKHPGLAPPPA
ncbi:GNAT family N-acetyltransferase [Actinomadura sp. SCN-SB]|uniref:GNAT family N-acetyltransferase n=1 Tax=Actinomadura sp. SCN-SB TaxID=3373092 RepID=UPI003750B2B9